MPTCNWNVSYSHCSASDRAFRDSFANDPEPLQLAEEMAVDLLNAWTNDVYGVCEIPIRPYKCDEGCAGGARGLDSNGGEAGFTSAISGYGSPWQPVLFNGEWYNIGCGSCAVGNCTCVGSIDYLSLPYPTTSIASVREDGVELPDTAYHIEMNRYLVRTDGSRWRTCQNIEAPATEPDTWEVVIRYGVPVPTGGRVAAGLLATEIARALCNDDECRLPERLQSISRQGVSMEIMDTFDDLEKGRTGLWLVDSWLASVNRPRGGRVSMLNPDQLIRDTARRGGVV